MLLDILLWTVGLTAAFVVLVKGGAWAIERVVAAAGWRRGADALVRAVEPAVEGAAMHALRTPRSAAAILGVAGGAGAGTGLIWGGSGWWLFLIPAALLLGGLIDALILALKRRKARESSSRALARR